MTYLVKFTVTDFGATHFGSVQVNASSAEEARDYVLALHPHQAALAFDPPMDKRAAQALYGNTIVNPHDPMSGVNPGKAFDVPIEVTSVEKYLSPALLAIMAEHGLSAEAR